VDGSLFKKNKKETINKQEIPIDDKNRIYKSSQFTESNIKFFKNLIFEVYFTIFNSVLNLTNIN